MGGIAYHLSRSVKVPGAPRRLENVCATIRLAGLVYLSLGLRQYLLALCSLPLLLGSGEVASSEETLFLYTFSKLRDLQTPTWLSELTF